MDSKQLGQLVDMIDGLKSQTNAIDDVLKQFTNDHKNNEKSSVSQTLCAQCQSQDANDTLCSEYNTIESVMWPT